VSAPPAADYLIIGSGIAGRRAAIELAAHGDVVILTKAAPDAGSTGFAQGGIAAAVGDDDSPARHAADTIAAGDGLCDDAAVRVLVEDGVQGVRELIDWGAAFDRGPDGSLELAREGAHSVRRVLHAKDATGREIARVLAARLAGHPRVRVVDHALAVQAIVADGRVSGVRYLDRDGRVVEARARATLLATGGAGQVFRETTNPVVATGDGVTLAYLAGAQVGDLEFVQFHPTALAVPGVPRYLLSEALRGEGARLVNAAGEPFVTRYTPGGDLASRDQVSRAIVSESERTASPVFLTMAHLPAASVRARFPLIASLCQRAGLDLATDRIPVGPAAHYMMGGVVTDLDGRTSLPGLFAAGEVAATGVHGANRLASNSLLEGLVFGLRAGRAMRAWDGAAWPSFTGTPATPLRLPPPETAPWAPSIDESALRDLMWTSAGVIRQAGGPHGLAQAQDALDRAWATLADAVARGASFDEGSWRVASLLTVGRLIVRAALRRRESRGAHWRADAPPRDDAQVHVGDRVFEARG
jgi:L-aspartate oxidase